MNRTIQAAIRKSLLFALLLPAAIPADADSLAVKDSHDNPFARMLGNPYGWITVITSSGGPGTFSCKEKMFSLMPQLTVLDKATLDENESRIRLFLDPQIRCLNAAREQDKSVRRWEHRELPDGIELLAVNAPSMPANVRFRVQPSAEFSVINFTMEVNNPGDGEQQIECECPFYGQLPGINPPHLEIPHEVTRFHAVNGKVEKRQVVLREEIELSGNPETYWWRKQIDNQTLWQLNNTIREEKIPFTLPGLKAPAFFAVSGLVGNSILVFDGMKEMVRLEVMWQAAILRVTPILRTTVPPKSSRKLTFRLLLGKGVTRIDNVTDYFVSAYIARGKDLEVSLMPLAVYRQITLDVALQGSMGNVIANRSFEVKGMSPFEPWSGKLELNNPLIATDQYPIKLRLNDTISAKLLYELENVVVP